MGFEFSDRSYTVDQKSGDLIELGVDKGLKISTVDRTIQDLARIFHPKADLPQWQHEKIDHIISLAHECKGKTQDARCRSTIEHVLGTLHGMKSKAEAPEKTSGLETEASFRSLPLELQREVGRLLGPSTEEVPTQESIDDLNNYLILNPKLIPTHLFKKEGQIMDILTYVNGDVTKIPEPLKSAIRAAGKSTTSLSLPGHFLTAEQIKNLLELFPAVRALNLSAETKIPESLKNAAPTGDKSIAWLSLAGHPLTAEQVRNYAELFSGVTHVNLKGCNLQNDALTELGRLVAVTSLDLSDNRDITLIGFAKLAPLANLETLILSNCQHVNDAVLKSFEGMKKLRTLDCKGCSGITDVGLGLLQRLPLLQHLDLSSAMLTNVGIAQLNGSKELTSLVLPLREGVTPLVLQTVAMLPKIETCSFVFPNRENWKYTCTFKDGKVDSTAHDSLNQLSNADLNTLFSFAKGSKGLREEFAAKFAANNYELLGHVLKQADGDANRLPEVLRNMFLSVKDKIIDLTIDWDAATNAQIEQLTASFPRLQTLNLGWCTISHDEAKFALSKNLKQLSIDKLTIFFSLIKDSKPLMEKFTARFTDNNCELLTQLLNEVHGDVNQLPDMLKKQVLDNREKIRNLVINPICCRTLEELKKLQATFPNLQTLDLGWCTISGGAITLVHEFENLYFERLNILFSLSEKTPLWNKFAEQLIENSSFFTNVLELVNYDINELPTALKDVILAKRMSVQALDLSCPWLGANRLVAQLKVLSETFPNIHNLTIMTLTLLSPNFLQELKVFKGLVHLSFYNLWLAAEPLRIIAKSCPQLQNLDLGGCDGSSEFIQELGRFKKLKGLSGLPRNISGDIKTLCRVAPNLEQLDLRYVFSDMIATELVKLKKLKSLNLGKNSMSAHAFAMIGSISGLTELDLRLCDKVDDEGVIDLFQNSRNLERLSVAFCSDLSDASLRQIPPKLRDLNIAGWNKITDAGLASLIQSKVQRVVLPNAITYKGLQSVAKMPELRVIAFQDLTDVDRYTEGVSQVTDNDLKALVNCSGLNELNLDGCKNLTADGIIEVAKTLRLQKLVIPFHLKDKLSEFQRILTAPDIKVGGIMR